MANKSESVKVVVRCRPLNSREKEQRFERIVDMDVPRGVIELRNPKAPHDAPKSFTFDSIYDWNSKQRDLYEESFRGLVDSAIEGFNATIFAYGQTGTGKTHTMQGVRNDPDLRGVIPNSFEHIFSHIQSSRNEQYLVRAAYLEIYQEDIRDLLHKDQAKRLELKERPDAGVYVKDLSSCVCKDLAELERVMNVGDSNRSVGSTNMNEQSSRSHAILMITIDSSAEIGQDGKQHTRVGKLNLVDLAGSERQVKTGAEGERLKEATKINLSLSALGNVISALVDGKSTHVPYRDSKLTRLLQDSLGGNAKTVMVANIGPADYNFDETMSTLRYANRAKNIKNRPKINEDPKDGLLRQFQEEIARLKDMLSQQGGPKSMGKRRRKKRVDENGQPVEGEEGDSEEDIADDPQAVEAFMNERQKELEAEREAILGNKGMITEEKQRILSELLAREEQLEKERVAQRELAEQVRVMESKVLGGLGGRSIEAHTREQDRQLAERRKQLAEKQASAKRIQDAVEEQESALMTVQTNYKSLQDEVNDRTKKLKALFRKLQQIKQETADLQEEQRQEREDLEATQNELTKELKKRQLIMENFIPPDERDRLLMRLVFEEEEETWRLRNLSDAITQGDMAKRPKSAKGSRRPVTEYARRNMQQRGLARYKGENILLIELDLPNRTTRDYEGPQVAPRVQAALDAALNDDQPIEIDCAEATGGSKTFRRPTTARGNANPVPIVQRNEDSSQFPTSRGLVSRR